MPELDVSQPPIEPATGQRGGVRGQRPYRYPGYPDDGRLTAQEATYFGHRFGIDTPYLATPTGWGEWIPLLGDPLGDIPLADIVDLSSEPHEAPLDTN